MFRKFAIAIPVIFIWLGCAGFLYRQMLAFENQPGKAARNVPTEWPPSVSIERNLTQPTLLTFVHPKCTCTRASMTQIAKLQDTFPNRFRTVVVAWQPDKADGSWDASAMLTETELKDYGLIWDRGGRIAAIFGARTSGQTYIYDKSGHLMFCGGVTSARASTSSGPASVALEQVFRSPSRLSILPVFGCSF